MINAIEYHAASGGRPVVFKADKNVKEKNAWHLRAIDGNGMPKTAMLGSTSHGLAGVNYGGISVDAREVEVELYADGFSPAGCQRLLDEARRVFSVGNDALGVLKLRNAAGDVYRIPAKATEYAPGAMRRSTAELSAVFSCPYSYFESDHLNAVPLATMTGGKTWPLQRPYTFGEVAECAENQSVTVYNAGDVPAPVVFKLYGAGLSSVHVTNETTGRELLVSGVSVNGLEISTDANDLYCHAVQADGTRTDASAYVSLLHEMGAFVLEPGENAIRVEMKATSLTAAGTRMEWRGRFSSCL